jgi:predicted metalloprotease with PDZ domain
VARDAEGDEVELTPDGTTAWRLPDGCEGPVEVELELYANDLTVRTNHVDDHHALLIPAATFPYVEGGEDRPHEVHLPAPDGEQVWSLLPEAGDDRTSPRTAITSSTAPSRSATLPTSTSRSLGSPTFVWSGHGGRPDLDRVARETTAIAEAAIELFGGELPVERYTLLCAGWDEGGGGLEHRDGAVLQMPIRTFQDDDLTARFQSLVAHEYLHLWNVKRLGPSGSGGPRLRAPDPQRVAVGRRGLDRLLRRAAAAARRRLDAGAAPRRPA